MKVSDRKKEYRARMEKYLETYKSILLIGVDNVGSKQLQNVRIELRGKAVILMGKNTLMRMVLREYVAKNPKVEALIPKLWGNVGFVFTNDDLNHCRNVLTHYKVPAAARTGAFAPIDVTIPAGPTGLDPGQTNYFQAMNIGTKIVKGSIEIMAPVHLIKQGERISASASSLLAKLNIKPFFYGIKVDDVYEDGALYPASILDMSDNDLLGKFFNGVRTIASLSLATGLPTIASLPHSLARGFKDLLAIAVETEITFKQAEKYKEYLADPAAHASTHGLSAGAPAAPGASAAKAAPAAAAAAKAPEPEPEEEEPAGFDLFD